MGFWDSVGGVFGVGSGDPSNPYRNALNANAQQQGQFEQSLQGAYAGNQGGIGQTQGLLLNMANGQDSVAAEQLRQGVQQQEAAQQSMAAGAAPQNQVMAARNAAMNMGRADYGMAGQQAMVGVQERQGALNALGQLQLGQSGQNMQGALGAGALTNSAYGTDLQNPQKTWGALAGGAISGGAAAAAKFV